MFPLGTVLFPHGFLPLHVFEERYRQMTRDCLAGDSEFGVVLIERGSEVGGGDVRTQLGTVARILQAAELPDGRWVLANAGISRIRVVKWLPDDPYPRAVVEDLEDGAPGSEAATLRDGAQRLLRRVLGLKAELSEPVAADTSVELDEDVAQASYQACVLAPIGPYDASALLAHGRPDERLAAVIALLEDEAEVLERRLAEG
jgi:Lon protease-like protein